MYIDFHNDRVWVLSQEIDFTVCLELATLEFIGLRGKDPRRCE